ncbi:MAG: 1-(5-phosphoribosyl)-5-[(5-phosphoribosylamino)methylideneamino]imidazole-4-carboxamide isomerase [Gammaproteobacteria bacterium]|nr:1-(5-phosphoribosyl)-5-[(5-phosphoribosylamino)methylideneamino]imidazole-4-carboxamide isomerase [Gammaproteobacteria bacterium]
MLLIPAIDLKDGKCVRLRQGRMEDETIFSDNPLDIARRWVEEGARRLHLVDLNGAFEGKPMNADVVREIAHTFPDLPIQVGGGIRTHDTVQTYLDAGVQYVIIGTKAVSDPGFIHELCRDFAGHIIVGLDAKEDKVAVDGWAKVSDMTVIETAQQFEQDGVEAIVYTDISRDGMMAGVNVEATARLASAINIPVIASGGVTRLDDISGLCAVDGTAISGAIIGRALYEGTIDLAQAQALADQ